MPAAYGGHGRNMEAIAVGFVVLGGIGLVAGGVLGFVSARQGWPWWLSPAVGLAVAGSYMSYVLVELRGCSYEECGESAYQLGLITAAANAATWIAASLATFGLARRRVTQE